MTGMVRFVVAYGEVGSAVVGVDVAGSSVVCCLLAFGAEAVHCMGLEGMGYLVDCEPVRSAVPREAEASPGAQQSSFSCVVGGGGHWLIVEVVKALLAGLTSAEVVLWGEYRLPLALLRM